MGALAWVAAMGLERQFGTSGLRAQLVTGLVPVVAGTLAYALLTRALHVREAEVLWRMVRERLARTT
jgi:hypothetical protein